MDTVTIIACHGNAWYSKIIQEVEHGPVTHIAGLILESTLEAMGVKDPGDRYPGTWLHPPDKYIDGKDCEFIKLPVENIDRGKQLIWTGGILGTLYGYPDCITAGVYRLLGIQLPADGDITAMCSEQWTRLIREMGPIGYSLPDLQADFVDPQRFVDCVRSGRIE